MANELTEQQVVTRRLEAMRKLEEAEEAVRRARFALLDANLGEQAEELWTTQETLGEFLRRHF